MENELDERISRRDIRKEATKKFILGLLFEVDVPKEQKEKTAQDIVTSIFESGCWDKNEFQKVALGYLYEYAGKVPNDQLVAMSVKIKTFV